MAEIPDAELIVTLAVDEHRALVGVGAGRLGQGGLDPRHHAGDVGLSEHHAAATGDDDVRQVPSTRTKPAW